METVNEAETASMPVDVVQPVVVEQVPLRTGYRDAVVKAATRDPTDPPQLIRAMVIGLAKSTITTTTAPDCQSVGTSVVTHHEIESVQSWAEDDDCFYDSVMACESSESVILHQHQQQQQGGQGGRTKEGGWKNVQSKSQQSSGNANNNTNQPSRGERRRRPSSSSTFAPPSQGSAQTQHGVSPSTTGGRFDALAPQSSKGRGWR